MTCSFVRILPTDVDVVLSLEEQIFPEEAWPREDFEVFLAQPTVCGFMAVVDQVPVGYILCHVTPPEGEILSYGLLPTAQGQGYGRQLLTHMMAWASQQHVKQLFLEVRRSNGRAIDLYEKAGAIPLGVRKQYYDPTTDHPEREDALTFTLPIPQDVY